MSKFQPGQSGNPGGRPKGLARLVRDLIAERQEQDATLGQIDGWTAISLRLYEVALGRTGAAEKDCTAAAKLLFERAFGAAKQEVDVSVASVSIEQLRAIDAMRMTPIERRQIEAEEPADADPDAS